MLWGMQSANLLLELQVGDKLCFKHCRQATASMRTDGHGVACKQEAAPNMVSRKTLLIACSTCDKLLRIWASGMHTHGMLSMRCTGRPGAHGQASRSCRQLPHGCCPAAAVAWQRPRPVRACPACSRQACLSSRQASQPRTAGQSGTPVGMRHQLYWASYLAIVAHVEGLNTSRTCKHHCDVHHHHHTWMKDTCL